MIVQFYFSIQSYHIIHNVINNLSFIFFLPFLLLDDIAEPLCLIEWWE